MIWALKDPTSGTIHPAFALLANQFTVVLTELVALRKEARKPKEERPKDEVERDKIRLPQIPYESNGHKDGMPTVRGWQDWIEKKLKPWASLVCEHFDVWLIANLTLNNLPPVDLDVDGKTRNFARVNQWLGFELCQMIKEPLATYTKSVSSTDGDMLLVVSHHAILQECEERISGLSTRFKNQPPCTNKGQLAIIMENWITDLKELKEAKAAPDKYSCMTALEKLLSGIPDIAKIVDLCDLVRPGCIATLYNTVRKRAAKWASLLNDPRLKRDGGGSGQPAANGADGRRQTHAAEKKDTPCRFLPKGTCTQGKGCPFSHRQQHNQGGGGAGGEKKGKGKENEKGKGKGGGKDHNGNVKKGAPGGGKGKGGKG